MDGKIDLTQFPVYGKILWTSGWVFYPAESTWEFDGNSPNGWGTPNTSRNGNAIVGNAIGVISSK